MKVLIIDDEIDLCLLLKSYFNRKGYDVMLAHTLSDGLAKVKTYQPDFLFLDNNLPDGIGWPEAASIAITNPEIYIYLISAYHPTVPLMPDTGHYIIMEKPISFSELDRHFEPGLKREKESSEESS